MPRSKVGAFRKKIFEKDMLNAMNYRNPSQQVFVDLVHSIKKRKNCV